MFRFLLLFSLILFSFPSTSKAQAVDPALCPEGYTCPDTSFKPVPGKEIQVEKRGFFGIDLPSFSGETGPSKDQLRSPDFSQEEKFFMDSEIISRSLPYEVVKKGLPEFEPDTLKGTLSHPGCGKVSVNGSIKGDTRIEQGRAELIPLTSSFNKLLLGFRFWEAQSSGDKPAKLKFKSIQPSGAPTLSENSGDCVNEGGEPYGEATTLTNPTPASAGLLENIASEIRKFISGLLTGAGATATATFSVQQTKIFPGEEAFAKQSNNFLNSFLPYEEAKKMIDQEEAVSYRAIGEGKVVGVPFEGAKSTQEKTVSLVKSLRPYAEAKLITTLGPGGTLPAPPIPVPGLYYNIAHKDKDVPIAADRKDLAIFWAKVAWPDTKIEQYWDSIVEQAKQAGVNPALVLAVWIQESGASSPTFFDGKIPKDSTLECFPGGGKTFPVETSASCIQEKIKQAPDFGIFVQTYCGLNQPSLCQNNLTFPSDLKRWYETLVPSGHGATQPL